MEPSKSSTVLSKWFHILHLCVSLGLVIVLVYYQTTNNSRLERLENQISSLKRQSDSKIYGGKPIATDLNSFHLGVKKDSSHQLASQQRIKINSTSRLGNEFENQNYSKQTDSKDEKKRVLMCLDMIRVFVIKNKANTKIRVKNVCQHLKGPKGDRGEPGAKGEIGPRGCRGESFAAPQFYPSPQNLVFTEREQATLFCNATSNPYSHITWYRNDVKITAGGRYVVKENVSVPVSPSNKMCDNLKYSFTQSSLIIKESRENDTGNYICEARNVMGFLKYPIKFLILVYVQFSTKPSNVVVVEKDNVQLSCRASGVPSPLITWKRKDSGRMPSVYRVVSGDLYITGITKEEDGVYQCIASNVLGNKTTEVTITVNVFPLISYFREKPLTINESQTLHLPCNATGFPEPQITWNKTEDYLPDNRTTYNSQHLNVSDVRYEDGGEYVCMANNILGNVSKRTTVVVQGAPKILERPDATEYGYRGYNKTLVFKVFSFPPASVEWIKNKEKMKEVSLENYSLILESVEYKDSGSYQAIARNILGKVKISTFLIVRDPVPPSIISQMIQRVTRGCGSRLPLKQCRILGNPSPTIVWKHNDNILKSGTGGSLTLSISNIQPRHFGRYVCEASNRFGKVQQHFNLVARDPH